MNVSISTTEKAILKLGWTVEEGLAAHAWNGHYRASQGGFKTLWRGSPEEVLADVRKIQEARKKPENVPF